MRIIVADDETSIQSALRLLLEQSLGHQIVGEAGSASELLALAEVQHPDLVLLDWELPGLSAASISSVASVTANGSGQRVLSELRSSCPALKIIALSGWPEARQAALAAGVNAFISKNDPPAQLLAAHSAK